jgi:hypothetical protein
VTREARRRFQAQSAGAASVTLRACRQTPERVLIPGLEAGEPTESLALQNDNATTFAGMTRVKERPAQRHSIRNSKSSTSVASFFYQGSGIGCVAKTITPFTLKSNWIRVPQTKPQERDI